MRRRIVALFCVLCLLLGACAPNAPVTPPAESQEPVVNGVLQVHVIDVGQGDSTLIRLPDGATLLIDAGERDQGETVMQYLQQQGIRRVDYLVGTHPHSDHIGGLRKVVENFEIGKIYMPKKSSTTATFQKLLEAIKKKGGSIETAKAGKVIAQDEGLKIEILSPAEDNYGDEMNLYSVVVRITYGERRLLFMGDAETENERAMADVAADFIRVGHHGSRTSSGAEFVARVGARIAVISVGKGNSYGLPDEDVLERWTGAGAKIYRTDEAGSLVFECDGKNITLGETVFGPAEQPAAPTVKWVLNTSSKKIHCPDCSSVATIGNKIKSESNKSIAELTAEGYTPCGICDPTEG